MVEKILLVEPSVLQRLIHEELQGFFEILKAESHHSEEWLDSKDVPSYLKVSRKTWQSYRDQRLIPFSQIGRKIWVKRSDLDAFLEGCSVKPSNPFGYGK